MVLMFMQWRDNIRKTFILQKYTNVCFCQYVISFNLRMCFIQSLFCVLSEADLNAINQCCIASVYYIASSGQYSTVVLLYFYYSRFGVMLPIYVLFPSPHYVMTCLWYKL